ncbi:hypothetical protein NDU88_009243 [Pleurodeles waltl]|uniref:Uncharacterized protein n=1 Tax=Pleurodeles waltl TaxID=8319 RepID=A0AAV7RUP5_PLEWA|nr:hypothetical protein NDU88_009243 [Pleurodeles waltl]
MLFLAPAPQTDGFLGQRVPLKQSPTLRAAHALMSAVVSGTDPSDRRLTGTEGPPRAESCTAVGRCAYERCCS